MISCLCDQKSYYEQAPCSHGYSSEDVLQFTYTHSSEMHTQNTYTGVTHHKTLNSWPVT